MNLYKTFRNKVVFDENEDLRTRILSPQNSSDSHNAHNAHITKRSFSEVDSQEKPSVWCNLPKDLWKTAAEVNNLKKN